MISRNFDVHKEKPPLKNQPLVAGAISWVRLLYQRIKNPILRFQEMEELLGSDEGKKVRAAPREHLFPLETSTLLHDGNGLPCLVLFRQRPNTWRSGSA